MSYNLKDKIKVTEEFLVDLITKSWQDAEALQRQADNIDTDTTIGYEVVKALQNISTAHYVLAGCLEEIADKFNDSCLYTITDASVATEATPSLSEPAEEPDETLSTVSIDEAVDFEPFEYFIDFDEPSGDPISDHDLYG